MLKGNKRVRQADIWGKNILGKINSRCESSEARGYLACSDEQHGVRCGWSGVSKWESGQRCGQRGWGISCDIGRTPTYTLKKKMAVIRRFVV